jgi:hypothetical protein
VVGDNTDHRQKHPIVKINVFLVQRIASRRAV